VLLIPTWFLLVIWVIAAGMTVAGSVTNDIVGPALLGGLVLIVMLIGFTVMQHAFAGGGATNGVVSDVERRALALTGSGDLIWDWDVSADKVFTSPETESLLGLKRGTLEGPAAKWLEVLHPLDQDRFSAAAGWCRIFACVRLTATSCGLRSRPAPWSAPTARSRAWSAR
jgi:PAS domain-containing protein